LPLLPLSEPAFGLAFGLAFAFELADGVFFAGRLL
jgi:hypothetical protein